MAARFILVSVDLDLIVFRGFSRRVSFFRAHSSDGIALVPTVRNPTQRPVRVQNYVANYVL